MHIGRASGRKDETATTTTQALPLIAVSIDRQSVWWRCARGAADRDATARRRMHTHAQGTLYSMVRAARDYPIVIGVYGGDDDDGRRRRMTMRRCTRPV